MEELKKNAKHSPVISNKHAEEDSKETTDSTYALRFSEGILLEITARTFKNIGKAPIKKILKKLLHESVKEQKNTKEGVGVLEGIVEQNSIIITVLAEIPEEIGK